MTQTGVWKVTWEGEAFTSDDLTLRELETFQQQTSVPYSRMNLERDAKQLGVFIALFLLRSTPAEDVEKILEEKLRDVVTLKWVKDNVEWVADDLPKQYNDGIPDPKEARENSTTT